MSNSIQATPSEAALATVTDAKTAIDAVVQLLGETCNVYVGPNDTVGSLISDMLPSALEILRIALTTKLEHSPTQEVELLFEGDLDRGQPKLTHPVPLVRFIQWAGGSQEAVFRFRLASRMLVVPLVKSDKGYTLRITPNLVVFGGVVVWRS